MLNRRQLLLLSALAALPPVLGAPENTRQTQAVYDYLDRFCKKHDATILIDGLIVSLDTDGFKKFDLAASLTWESIEKLCPLIGFHLVRSEVQNTRFLLRQPTNRDFFLQYKPKEMIQCIERLLKKSPFQEEFSLQQYEVLTKALPYLLKAERPTPLRKFPLPDRELLYTVLGSGYAVMQSSGYKNLLIHLRGSLLSDSEFQWFNLFDTGHKVFGYRVRGFASGLHKEVIMSHGFKNNLQGYSDLIFRISDNNVGMVGFPRVDSQAPALNEKARNVLKSLKYDDPDDLPLLVPALYNDKLIHNLKLENKEIDSYPQDMERCCVIIGKHPEKKVVFEFLQACFDLKVNSSNGLEIITNKPVSSYKPSYTGWLKSSTPTPISNFIQQYLLEKQANLEKRVTTLEESKSASQNIAKDLLNKSNLYIRNHVEKKLPKDQKLKITEADYLVQVAFVNRLFAMFVLEQGLNDFEVPGGVHTQFDSLYVQAVPLEDTFRLDFGVLQPSGGLTTYLSIMKGGNGLNRPW